LQKFTCFSYRTAHLQEVQQAFFKKVIYSREMMMKTQKRKKLAILHQVCPGQIQKKVDEQTLQESYNSRRAGHWSIHNGEQ